MRDLRRLSVIVLIGLLTMLALACEVETNPPPEPTVPRDAASPTTGSDTAAAQAPTPVPTDTPIPTPTPTPVPTNTPVPTPTPTPLPIATPVPSQAAIRQQEALVVLQTLEADYPEIVRTIAEYPWLTDGIEEDELLALQYLLDIVQGSGLGSQLSAEQYLQLTEQIERLSWLADGISPIEREILFDVSTESDVDLRLTLLRFVFSEDTTPSTPGPPPVPTPTMDATATPRPTLGPLVALSDLPWAKDGLTELEQQALAHLQTFGREYPEMAQVILRYPWIADSIEEDEQLALRYILNITKGGIFADGLSDEQYRKLVERMPHHLYLIDGISRKERQLLSEISSIPDLSMMLANFIAANPEDYTPSKPTHTPPPTPAPVSGPTSFPWAQDGLTDIERQALGYLQEIQSKHQSIAEEVLKAPWLPDGITEGERRLLCHIATTAESGTALAIIRSTPPSESLPACPKNN